MQNTTKHLESNLRKELVTMIEKLVGMARRELTQARNAATTPAPDPARTSYGTSGGGDQLDDIDLSSHRPTAK